MVGGERDIVNQSPSRQCGNTSFNSGAANSVYFQADIYMLPANQNSNGNAGGNGGTRNGGELNRSSQTP